MGRSTVERDGVSVAHAARLVLVGTMNPEEGELRPQLLDRFGLTVEVAAPRDPALRSEVVRRRLAYDADPDALVARFADQEETLRARLAAAQERLDRVQLSDWALTKIAAVCAGFEVDGMRADIVTARASVAHAAWHDRTEVTRADIRAAARLALPHRRRRNPFDAPGLDEELLDRLLGDDDLEPEPEPEPPTDPPGHRPRGPDAGGHRWAGHADRRRRDRPDRPGHRGPRRTCRRPGSARRAARRTRPGEHRAGGAAVPGAVADRARHRRRRGRAPESGADQRRPDRRRHPDRRQPAALPGDRPRRRDRAAAPRAAGRRPVAVRPRRPADRRDRGARVQPGPVLRRRLRLDGRAPADGRGEDRRAVAAAGRLPATRQGRSGHLPRGRRDAGAAAHLVGRGGGPTAGGGAERRPYAVGRGTAVRGGHIAAGSGSGIRVGGRCWS